MPKLERPSTLEQELTIKDLLAEVERLKGQVADLEEVLADKRRLTRELDVALSGEAGAAPQASLCDLIPIAMKMRELLDRSRCYLDADGSSTHLQNEIYNFLYGEQRQ